MLYILFLVLAIFYNIRKFRKERSLILKSLIEAKSVSHREMILGHYFYIFIFEGFLAFIVAHLLTEKAVSIGIWGLGIIYLCLVFGGFYLYRFFIRYLEKITEINFYEPFKRHLIKEFRVNFALVLLPVMLYSLINWAFQDSIYSEWGSYWFVGLIINIIFVSVLMIICTVIIMLKLIPNREISEPEYLEIIDNKLQKLNRPEIRLRWIETDIKNAFIAGLKLGFFSNQTLFIGKSLRNILTIEEFDAVISHELGHVANKHTHKRILEILKNFISIIFGIMVILLFVLVTSFIFFGDEAYLYSRGTVFWCVLLSILWFILNYVVLFDTFRSHEFEADGFAVLELGANSNALKSALKKLSSNEDLPEILLDMTKSFQSKKSIGSWFTKIFSSHPEVETRIAVLENKVEKGLPFNYYISAYKRIKNLMSTFLHLKFMIPAFLFIIIFLGVGILKIKRGNQLVVFIESSDRNKIMINKEIISKINTRPLLVGNTLMFFIVQKRDPVLIDYFVSQGADKSKTLLYLGHLKDYELFKRYFIQWELELSHDDFFLILRKTAQNNFIEGYRLLVNAKQFENMSKDYKEDVSRLNQKNQMRSPASDKSLK